MRRSSLYWLKETARRTARTVVAMEELKAALDRDKADGRLPFGMKYSPPRLLYMTTAYRNSVQTALVNRARVKKARRRKG